MLAGDALGMELDAVDRQIAVPKPWTVPSSAVALTMSASGTLSGATASEW